MFVPIVEIDLPSLTANQKRLARHKKKIENMTYVMHVIGNYMVSETQQNFLKEQAPDGSKWKKSKAAKKRGGRSLFDRGHLFKSINYKIEGKHSVTYGANVNIGGTVIYARIHNFGGFTGRNHATKIKKRQFVGVNDINQKEISDIILNWIMS